MTEYNNRQYTAERETAEFSCEGCSFAHETVKTVNIGTHAHPEYKEEKTGARGCGAPNIEPFRSCKRDHEIYRTV